MPARLLRILTVADVPPDPDSGAAGKIVQANAALRELGHDVRELWAADLGPRRIRHGNLHSLLEQPQQMRTAILREIERWPIDVVLSHQPQSYAAARAFRQGGYSGRFFVVSQGVEARIAPVLTEWHRRLDVPRSRWPRSLLTPLFQRLLASQWDSVCHWCDGVIVDNSQDRDFVIQRLGVNRERTFVWPSGLPEEFLKSSPDPMTHQRLNSLLHVGQFAFYKGPHLVAKILAALLHARPAVRATWVCHERDHACVRSLIPDALQERVQLRGWMAFRDLLQLFDSHGVFLFPTIAEGFGRAALEAMSRGMCVVASNCSGMRDYIVHRENGALCQIGHLDAFVGEVEHLLDSEPTARTVSDRAIATARTFTWEAVTADLVQFLRMSSSRVVGPQIPV